MPIFVGSNSDDSRIRSNRVGFAVSTANPGSASEGDVYFNSSDSGLRAYDGSGWSAVGAGGGTFSGIASGALSNGQTVIIQSDGTVKAVGLTTSGGDVGTAVTFSSYATTQRNIAFDTGNNKIVIGYYDGSNGMAVVGTVSGSSISFGTPVQFDSGEVESVAAAYGTNDNGRICIVYTKQSTSRPRAIAGQVSGTSISFGSPTDLQTGQGNQIGLAYDASDGVFVAAWRDYSNSYYGTAMTLAVSGSNGITKSSKYVYNSSQSVYNVVVYDSNAEKTVILYKSVGNSGYGSARVCTSSSAALSFGTEVTIDNSAQLDDGYTAAFDSENNKIVYSYRLSGNVGFSIVGTVSGTDISFGTPVHFNNGDDATSPSTVYDSNAKKIVVSYRDNDDSKKGKLREGTVVGTSITFTEGPKIFAAGDTIKDPFYITNVFDSSNNKVVISYTALDNSSAGESVVYTPVSSVTNLTSSNFLGFSDAAYSDGATATVQIAGAVDDAQSGLTTASVHYVQNDGTLSTTADTPSVEAGTALSATKIKVKK